MLTPLDRIKLLYAKIIKDALESENQGCTTYIFVSNDTDSLCAMRILTVSYESCLTIYR
jgi:hypothetical protein